MKNYDLPTVDENMTAAEVTAARNVLSIDGRNDPEHPYFCAAHPEHAAWMEYAGQLAAREVAAEAETKRLEQDTALDAARGLLAEAGIEVDPDAGPEAQIEALEAIPGFIDGTLRRTDRAQHDKISAARSALYARAFPEESEEDE